MAGSRLRKRNLGLIALAWLAGLARRSRAAAKDVPLSPVRAGRYVGADFLRRRGLVDREAPAPNGELDDLDEFGSDTFDPEAVRPSVRRFYEETAAYAMDYRVTWSFGFRFGAALAGRFTSRIEQLNLPNWGSGWRPLDSRFVAVDVPGDPRKEVRGWVRTTTERGDAAGAGDGPDDADREAVFVALYGAYEADEERLVNIAVPLPGGNLSTVLRARNVDDGIEWTTEGGGDPGLYLVTPLGPFRLPMSQRFVVWNSSSAAEPDLRARHEMAVFGLRFLTVEYRMERAAAE
ncbi:hypothetical protein [Haloparvum sp. PAK95]|uniref:hypothetical protein n=1 Tax=Haloparvum sp. PAK95 TaxID=3418962 RepID=UPI003D2F4021